MELIESFVKEHSAIVPLVVDSDPGTFEGKLIESKNEVGVVVLADPRPEALFKAKAYGFPCVLLLGECTRSRLAFEHLDGVSGLITMHDKANSIVDAIAMAKTGSSFISLRANKYIDDGIAENPWITDLEEDERTVLRFLSQRMTEQQISVRCFMTIRTVSRHIQRMKKLLACETMQDLEQIACTIFDE